MPQQWALWLSVEDDLRFLSHHDMMRMIERASARAALPLRYSQGFNPHAILSLACPRPVGVASKDDLLILSLEDSPTPMEPQELLDRMNRACPAGMKCFKAENISQRGLKILHPQRISYELHLAPEQTLPVKSRLDELASQECWAIERISKKAATSGKKQPLDLKALVIDLRTEGDVLRWTLVPQGETWARPSEVLGLLGLDERIDLARTVRTGVEYA